MIGCETYAEYIARISGPAGSAWGATGTDVPSLHKAYVEDDLDGWA
jgi:hypothetical protein